jgi:hypothetical protein
VKELQAKQRPPPPLLSLLLELVSLLLLLVLVLVLLVLVQFLSPPPRVPQVVGHQVALRRWLQLQQEQ